MIRAVDPIASQRPPGTAPPGFAVIAPNHNDSRYLPRCVRLILEREDPPEELIVVDDQSTDKSIAVIRSLIAGQSRARLIENPVNLGTYGAVDEALKIARSEYVLFLADDLADTDGMSERSGNQLLGRHDHRACSSDSDFLFGLARSGLSKTLMQ